MYLAMREEDEEMKLEPLYDRVIVERIHEDEISPGGLYIPEQAKERPFRGRVLAVGRGRVLSNGEILPPTIKEGDEIVFGKYAGSEVKIEGKHLLLLKEDDIFARIASV